MLRSAVRVLLRKVLCGRHLRKQYEPMRRWLVRPCLEALELRTLPSTAWSAPVPPTVPPTLPSSPSGSYLTTWFDAASPYATATVDNVNAFPDVTTPDIQGLDRLLQDIGQNLTASIQNPPTVSGADEVYVSNRDSLLAHVPHGTIADGPSASVPGLPNPGRLATPPVRLSTAPVGPPSVNAGGAFVPPVAQIATPVSDGPALGSLPVASAVVPVLGVPDTATVAELWAVPQSHDERHACGEPGVESLQTEISAWEQCANAAPPAPAAQMPPPAVWYATNVGSAPEAAGDAFVPSPLQAGVNPLPGAHADGSLLERFVARRDQAAFTMLVARYERFVFSICQRVLSDTEAAEDAVQATFLVLARKASVLDPQRPLTGWLYLVAYHIALRLRAIAARRRRCEVHAARGRPGHQEDESAVELESQEIYQVLREELHRLPEKHRVPLILCYFQGRTHAEAADTIGMPRGSIAKRIGEGLEHLRQRLIDRGIAF
jgi:RNA polymerase sigma factor (sigma-70 family)